MFRDREQIRQRLREIIQKFTDKGATTPERAMSIQELGLPPRFEQAMHRRLGQTGIFVETNGKYYLNEERLKQIQGQSAQTEASAEGSTYVRQRAPGWLRYGGILLMLPIGIIVVGFLLFYFWVNNGAGYFPGEIIIILLVALLVLFVVRVLFLRERRKYWRERGHNRTPYVQ